MRGLFITIEGGEGAGKSTLIDRLSCELDIVKTREPGGTEVGESIRKILLTTSLVPRAELLLFLSSRAQHVSEVIQPALKSGKIVVCDRFHDSTIAYQGVARGLGRERVRELSSFASEGLWPDLTFYLDIDPILGLKRAKLHRTMDRIESEEIAFHETIRQAFLQIAKDEPDRIKVIDATQAPEQVFAEVMNLLQPMLNESLSH